MQGFEVKCCDVKGGNGVAVCPTEPSVAVNPVGVDENVYHWVLQLLPELLPLNARLHHFPLNGQYRLCLPFALSPGPHVQTSCRSYTTPSVRSKGELTATIGCVGVGVTGGSRILRGIPRAGSTSHRMCACNDRPHAVASAFNLACSSSDSLRVIGTILIPPLGDTNTIPEWCQAPL